MDAETVTGSGAVSEVRAEAADLVEGCGFAMVGSNGPDGFPWTKAMIKVEVEGLKRIWFSTNTSSERVRHYTGDPRASVYFVNMIEYRGLLLLGHMRVLTDRESRERIWRYGNEIYYPLGIDDPDYSVLLFTAHSGRYYHNLASSEFSL